MGSSSSMKGRSNRLPTSDPPDDWVNGSWTVDCICGVNFDDGEEMVNCDECGVWVHTRCSRFVRGEKSFACDKCKSKANNINRNDSEETEVAQLLVELPTKTIKMNNSYPLNNVPPPPPPRHPYRLWTERPIEQRVHVQGIPGGDPSLFQGFSSIFSSNLWKCTGYVPKKFNFCYREFPCWDNNNNNQQQQEENTVDKGAGVLYSLSKVTMRGQVKAAAAAAASDKKASKDRKWEGAVSKHNLVKKEKLRPIVLQCGKRSREDLGPSKDRGGKKKTKPLHKEQDSNKDKSHAPKTVVIHSENARQEEVHESQAQKVTKADAPGEKHGHRMGAVSQEVRTNAHLTAGSNTENPKSNAAADEDLALRSCEVSGLGYFSAKRVKAEKLGHDASDQAHKSDRTETASLEKDAVARNPMKKEGLVLHDMSRNQAVHSETPTSDLLKSNYLDEGVAHAALEVKCNEILNNLVTNTQLSSAHFKSKTETDADVDNSKEVPRSCPSDIVAKSDGVKDLSEQVLSADREPENSKVNETVMTSCQSQSNEYEGREGDNGLEAVSDCKYRTAEETTKTPGTNELECHGPETSIEVSEIPSDLKQVPRVAGEASKLIAAIPPPPTSEQTMASVGKSSSSSSTIVISRSSISDKNRVGHLQNASSTGKRSTSSSNVGTKKENGNVDLDVDDKHDKPKSTMKDIPKSSNCPILKASQSSRASSSPIMKHYTSVGKESLRNHSSKSSLVDSSLHSSNVGEPSASLPTQHALHVQNKNIAPLEQQRDEKVHLQSSKSTQSSLGHLPPSSNSPAGLSDEELALLLHQELNSSPRVPRVPRVRHAGSVPQLSSLCATSMLTKRTSSSSGKDQYTFTRRKIKDGSRSSRERDNDARKADRVPSSPDSAKTSVALTQMEANSESLHSPRKNVETTSTSAVTGGPSSTVVNELKNSSSRHSLVNNREADTGTNKGVAPTYRTLPRLIDEIMGKGRHMTYEELCNAVLPHWQNLRKHNGERYAYSSHSQAVLDCLRNRTQWSGLVDRGPKTNAGRKKRKIDAEPPNAESEDGEDISFKDGDSKSFESNKEERLRHRKRVRKGRRLAQQVGIKDDRKRKKVEAGSDGTGSYSNSSEDSVSSEDDSQGSGMCGARSEVSASSDGLAAVS